MNTQGPSPRSLQWLAGALIFVGAIAIGSSAAWAHGPRVGFGIVVGPPYWGYYPYASPYYDPYYPSPYYAPPLVAAPSAPPYYVEKGQTAPAPQTQLGQPPVWYYCPAESGYYPYVRQCPQGWETVPAQPPPP